MINIQSIRSEIVGDSAATIPYTFVLAIVNHVRWPVDAFTIDAAENGSIETFYWVQGNVVGKMSAAGSQDVPDISGTIYPVSEISKVDIGGKVCRTNGGSEEFRRSLSIYFRGSDQPTVTVNVSHHNNQILRIHANGFIESVLQRLD
ncbi:hypothetical protein [Mycobacteroides abscessus]|uniref:hypothetical protein n=1 Tax=Mycobacteroides abscessus TaxID=36809 RepID=UPI000D3EDD2F|nr:hypothetical protein [Mycobacteroides abscessus]PVA36492.1 hypothetical protein DDJ88_11805 [Mycobacteroides abscessus]PVA43955.1 hypothetical protein DDJ35_20635 [Mycobacteroides abscessus]RIQ90764.1 hypothetical protein D2E34_12240 [Mycobacteroides abscessus]RIQ98904.1 hypothetical protein D2E30_09605 [Mycobacteroides abscessus]